MDFLNELSRVINELKGKTDALSGQVERVKQEWRTLEQKKDAEISELKKEIQAHTTEITNLKRELENAKK